MSYMPQSKSDIHPTPDNIFDIIYNTWNLKRESFFDPCPVNPKFDGLLVDWKKYNYVNPPYSDLPLWVIKAVEEADYGKLTVMLLPCKTDQWWFHALLYHKFDMRFIRGRLKFKGNKFTATQPHFLVVIV
uniref:ORF37 n=1 Tax=Nitrosopumilaceae spindle-shaped virus TaxID=3065433 RepID=A0AAT9J9M3_9VIRU